MNRCVWQATHSIKIALPLIFSYNCFEHYNVFDIIGTQVETYLLCKQKLRRFATSYITYALIPTYCSLVCHMLSYAEWCKLVNKRFFQLFTTQIIVLHIIFRIIFRDIEINKLKHMPYNILWCVNKNFYEQSS